MMNLLKLFNRALGGGTTAPPSTGRASQASIELEELRSAREDQRLHELLASAEAEGAAVESAGRKHW